MIATKRQDSAEREAQRELTAAEQRVKDAQEALDAARAAHSAAFYHAMTFRHAREGALQKAHAEQLAAERVKRAEVARAKLLEPLDDHIARLSQDAEEALANGNLAGAAGLRDRVHQLQGRRESLLAKQ